MASSWASSWGSSWGNSWGSIGAPTTPTDRGGDGFGPVSSDKRSRRRKQSLKRNLAYLAAQQRDPRPAPVEERPVTPTVALEATEAAKQLWPSLFADISLPAMVALLPPTLPIPAMSADDRNMMIAAIMQHIRNQAELAAMADDEADIEMLLLTAA